MVHIAAKRAAWPIGTALAERRAEVFCAVGIRPMRPAARDSTSLPRWSSRLRTRRWSRSARAASTISTTTPRATVSSRAFAPTSVLPAATGLPLIVHTRDAGGRTPWPCSRPRWQEGPFTGVIHCYSSSRRLAERAVCDRLPSRHRRHRHLQEVRGAARDPPRHTAEPAAAGDRRALSGAGPDAVAGPTSRPIRRTSPRCWLRYGVCR